ncbi:MAG TPA: hypothetical protein VHW64_06740 [Nocardioides sp.]|uniref:hypothetical protein n=1 Tax=Nocardioides sp. TaxID=35761 RepID=UPI002E30C4BB|nr:hypothetical protein [Nocardioides sp.]HEX3930383.1 hypothetical protein [Nocardioides sp.]
MPQVVVNVHTFAAPDADGIARVERSGAMSAAWVRDHLTRAARVTVRPVLDIEGQAPSTPTRSPSDIARPCA